MKRIFILVLLILLAFSMLYFIQGRKDVPMPVGEVSESEKPASSDRGLEKPMAAEFGKDFKNIVIDNDVIVRASKGHIESQQAVVEKQSIDLRERINKVEKITSELEKKSKER